MSEQDVSRMRQAYDAFNRGDIPSALVVFDPQIEWHEPGGGQAPRGTFIGPQQVVDNAFSKIPVHFERFEVAPDQFIDATLHLVVVGRCRGRTKGGQDFDFPFAHVWIMRDGKAARMENCPEAASWARAWGG